MLKQRLTYYRMNKGKLERARYYTPPEGWTRDLANLEIKQKIAEVETENIVITSPEVQINSENPLQDKIEELEKELKALKLENKVLNERLEKDPNALRRREEECRRKEMREIDRTAEYSRRLNSINHDEYFELKRAVQGLKLQIERAKEETEEVRKELILVNNIKAKYFSKMTEQNEVIALFLAALDKYKEYIQKLVPGLVYMDFEDLRNKSQRIMERCRKALDQIEWQPPEKPPYL